MTIADVTDTVNAGTGVFGFIDTLINRKKQYAREDSAVQRRAADLEAAGLSKTLAAGSAATSNVVQSPKGTQLDPKGPGIRAKKREPDIIQDTADTKNANTRADTLLKGLQQNQITTQTEGLALQNEQTAAKTAQQVLETAIMQRDYDKIKEMEMLYKQQGQWTEVLQIMWGMYEKLGGGQILGNAAVPIAEAVDKAKDRNNPTNLPEDRNFIQRYDDWRDAQRNSRIQQHSPAPPK